MKKPDWYENRIMWKAGQNSLQPYLWEKFLSSNEEGANSIQETVGYNFGKPLVVFWKSDEVWTLLTNEFLVGKIDGQFSWIHLDQLEEIKVLNNRPPSSEDFKITAEYLSVGLGAEKFWAPPGNGALFSLMNILMRFPLNVP